MCPHLHATFVAVFLVVAHVAMIFGMLNPTLFDYQAMVCRRGMGLGRYLQAQVVHPNTG